MSYSKPSYLPSDTNIPNFEVNVNNFSRLDVRHFDTWYGLLIKDEMTIGGNFKFFFFCPPPLFYETSGLIE